MNRQHKPGENALRPRVALALIAALLVAGCALVPPAPPDCDGPWTPINPAPTRSSS